MLVDGHVIATGDVGWRVRIAVTSTRSKLPVWSRRNGMAPGGVWVSRARVSCRYGLSLSVKPTWVADAFVCARPDGFKN